MSETSRYDPATQVNYALWQYRNAATQETWHVPLELRMYFSQELDALLHYNGFTIEHKYGWFDGRPFDADSPKQLIVCR